MSVPAEAAIRHALVELFNSDAFRPSEPVGPNDELLRNGLLDSFGFVVLLGHLDATYGVTLETDDLLELDHFRTVARLAAFLARKLDGVAPSSP